MEGRQCEIQDYQPVGTVGDRYIAGDLPVDVGDLW